MVDLVTNHINDENFFYYMYENVIKKLKEEK